MAKKDKEVKNRIKYVVGTRGRTFKGVVIKKFPTRIVIEFERTIYVPKYERFYKKKIKLHAKLPKNIDVNEGDYVKIRECRPLSKIIHFIVIEKLTSLQGKGMEKKEK